MAEGGAAGGAAAELDGDDLVVEQADEPEHGAHEGLVAAGDPAHVLGPVERGDLLGQFGGEDLGGAAALFGDAGGEIVTLGRGDGLEVGDGEAGLAREGFGGGGGRALLEGNFDGGAGELLGDVGLVGEDTGEVARRGGAGWSSCARYGRRRAGVRG